MLKKAFSIFNTFDENALVCKIQEPQIYSTWDPSTPFVVKVNFGATISERDHV